MNPTTPKSRDLPSIANDGPLFAGAGEPFADWNATDCAITLEEWRELEDVTSGGYTQYDDAADDLIVAALCEATS